MKRSILLLCLVLALGLLWYGITWADTPVKPGDKIGEMVVTTGGFEIPPLWAFCSPAFSADPGTTTTQCDVPPLPKLAVGHGWWSADEALRESTWSLMTWELYIDGLQVDLNAFGTFDADLPQKGVPGRDPKEEVITKLRSWGVVLDKLTPGAHTVRSVMHASQELNDGFSTTKPGTYELVANFTVAAGQPAVLPTTGGGGGDWLAVLLLALGGLGLLGAGWLTVRRQRM